MVLVVIAAVRAGCSSGKWTARRGSGQPWPKSRGSVGWLSTTGNLQKKVSNGAAWLRKLLGDDFFSASGSFGESRQNLKSSTTSCFTNVLSQSGRSPNRSLL